MVDAVIAEKMGVTAADADSLLSGRVFGSIQEAVGVPQGLIELFINSNEAADLLAKRFGVDMVALEKLGAKLGRDGRIGLIVGLLFGRKSERP